MKSLQKLVTKHQDKIADAYKDSDGYWINLKPGWRREEFDYSHSVHEWSICELVSAFRNVHPCDCENCQLNLIVETGQ